MLKKEFRDALKRLGECLFVLIGVPLGYLWDKLIVKFGWDFLDIFKSVFIVVVFIYAAVAGVTIFLAEKKDRAFEYLCSLPISKRKILMNKILSRISFLAALYFIMIFMTKRNLASTEGLYLIFIFLVSLFLSLSIDSVVIGLIGISLLLSTYFFAYQTISFMAWKFHIISQPFSHPFFVQFISALILMAPFGAAFWKILKNLDAKPLKLQMKPYYTIALPSFLILVALIIKFYGEYMSWARNLK
jgi:ABC-type Na+ efflux pump permease subunit